MAIAVLILWLATAAAGVSLLRAGSAARRLSATNASRQSAASLPARTGAIPLTPDGKPPPSPRTRVATPPGEHPLLEFSHPALAVTGIACWTMFVFVHYRPFAWIAFGVLVATLSVGLGWLASNQHAVKRQARAAWTFPRRLVVLHGLAATVSIVLTVLTALSASRG